MFNNDIEHIYNCTPHIVRFYDRADGLVMLHPDMKSMRGTIECNDQIGYIFDIPVQSGVMKVVDIPPPEKGCVYLVSGVIARQLNYLCPERTDIVTPNTFPDTNIVRKNGKIHATKGMRQYRVA